MDKEMIKEWAKMVSPDVNENEDIKGNNIFNQITGNFSGYNDDKTGHQTSKFLMANFDIQSKKWIILSVIQDDETKAILDVQKYDDKTYETIEDAVGQIRNVESDNSLDGGE